MNRERIIAVILAPTFNNAATLGDVLERIEHMKLPGMVVNDGSTDQTSQVLERFASFTVLTHPVNLGKAAAMQTGFRAAAGMGFTHALTIDTDGQHNPAQIPQLLEGSRQSPALILGTRDYGISGYPLRSRLGRKISNLLVWLESGLYVEDTQCGLRVYPLNLVAAVPCKATRYGYETEILTKAAWQGFAVEQMKVNCVYFQGAGRVSHFHPVVDSLRGGHAREIDAASRAALAAAAGRRISTDGRMAAIANDTASTK